MRGLFIVARILGAAAIVAAIVGQLITTWNFWEGKLEDRSILFVNFFSFFTIDSNVGAAVVFVIGAVVLLRRIDDPRWFGILRACVTAYMAVTGIVYNTLLRGIALPQGTTLEWSNEILHVAAPILLVLDWLLAPGRIRLEWKNLWWVVSFPLVWVAYTMVRGPLVTNPVTHTPPWYPYPFLNPDLSPEGYVSVGFYIVLIAAVIIGVGAAVVRVSRQGRWPLPARG